MSEFQWPKLPKGLDEQSFRGSMVNRFITGMDFLGFCERMRASADTVEGIEVRNPTKLTTHTPQFVVVHSYETNVSRLDDTDREKMLAAIHNRVKTLGSDQRVVFDGWQPIRAKSGANYVMLTPERPANLPTGRERLKVLNVIDSFVPTDIAPIGWNRARTAQPNITVAYAPPEVDLTAMTTWFSGFWQTLGQSAILAEVTPAYSFNKDGSFYSFEVGRDVSPADVLARSMHTSY